MSEFICKQCDKQLIAKSEEHLEFIVTGHLVSKEHIEKNSCICPNCGKDKWIKKDETTTLAKVVCVNCKYAKFEGPPKVIDAVKNIDK